VRRLTKKILAIIGIFLCGCLNAQDLVARRYINLPVDQNFLSFFYSYSEGDVNVSPSAPLQDAFLRIDGPALHYLRTFGLAGRSGSVDVFMPYVCASGNALLDGERVSRTVCGQGDLRLRINYNFIGAPTVALSEFARQKRDIVVGASLQLSAPTGRYDDDRLLNIGSNRWFIKPEIGVTIPWRNWSFEFAAGVRFFTDNDDYVGGSKFEQDPLYNVHAHVSYDLTPRQWISLDSNYFFGGKTFRNNMPSAIRQENSRLGLTWSMTYGRLRIKRMVPTNTNIRTPQALFAGHW